MNNNYLLNILDKNSQSNLIVEPRLKSRFETSSVVPHDDNYKSNFEKVSPFIQEKQVIIENVSEDNKKGFTNNFETINSEENITNVKHEHQTEFLNTTENHFLSFEHKIEENREEGKIPMLSISKNDEKKSIEMPIDNSTSTFESTSYGMLNQPIITSANKQNGSTENHENIIKDNALTTNVQPSIKISIGRVEVKVVKPSQKLTVKPKAKPNLKMSLEDYIDKRK